MPKKTTLPDQPLAYSIPFSIEIGVKSSGRIADYLQAWNSKHPLLVTTKTYEEQAKAVQDQVNIRHTVVLQDTAATKDPMAPKEPVEPEDNNTESVQEEHVATVIDALRDTQCDTLIAMGNAPLRWTAKIASLAYAEEKHPPKNSRDTAYRPMLPLISLANTPWKGLYGESLVEFDGERIEEPTLYPRVLIMDSALFPSNTMNVPYHYDMTMAMILMGLIQNTTSPFALSYGKSAITQYVKTFSSPEAEDLFTLGAHTERIMQAQYKTPLALLEEVSASGAIDPAWAGTFLVWALYKSSPHLTPCMPVALQDTQLKEMQSALYAKLQAAHITPDIRAFTNAAVALGSTKAELTLIKDIIDAMDWYQRGRKHL